MTAWNSWRSVLEAADDLHVAGDRSGEILPLHARKRRGLTERDDVERMLTRKVHTCKAIGRKQSIGKHPELLIRESGSETERWLSLQYRGVVADVEPEPLGAQIDEARELDLLVEGGGGVLGR
jgi:hypothetical protein